MGFNGDKINAKLTVINGGMERSGVNNTKLNTQR